MIISVSRTQEKCAGSVLAGGDKSAQPSWRSVWLYVSEALEISKHLGLEFHL